MILHQFNSSTYLEGRIKAYWDKYSNEVNALHEKQSKDEDLKGKSLNQWKIMQYYYVMYLMILIYLDKQLHKNQSWSYYITKYNLVKYQECLACVKIDLKTILTIFNFSSITQTDGVETLEIETTLEIEPDDIIQTVDTSVVSVDVLQLLNVPTLTYINLN